MDNIDLIQRITSLETHIVIFKTLAGAAFLLAMSIGGWVYARGDMIAQLSRDVKHQAMINNNQNSESKEQWKKIDKNKETIHELEIRQTEAHIVIADIRSDLKEIKQLIKEIKNGHNTNN